MKRLRLQGVYELCVIHPPSACPTLRGAEEVPYSKLEAEYIMTLSPSLNPAALPANLWHEQLTYAQRPQSSIRGAMTLQTFAHSSTENFAA